MTAKEYLKQAFYFNRQIKAKEKRLEWLREITPGPCMRFSEELKAAGNQRSSVVESAALNIVALENEIADDIVHLLAITKDIEKKIRQIDSMEMRTILEMRYLSFMSWEEITARMGYGSSYVFRKHREALRTLNLGDFGFQQ